MGARLNILIIFVVSLILGVPVWWMTTNVYRADIYAIDLANAQQISSMPIRLQVHLINTVVSNTQNSELAFLTAQIQESFTSIAKSSRKSCPLALDKIFSTSSQELPPALGPQELDAWIERSIASNALSSSRNGLYAITVIVDPSVSKPSATIGARRHAWIRIPSIEAIKSLRPVFDTQLRRLLVNDVKIDSPRRKSYRFTFSLLNEDPSTTIPTWNFSTLYKAHLGNVIETMEELHKIEVDSQIVHYAQLKTEPFFDKQTSTHYFTPATLPHFVDGTEWKVDSASNANENSLHMAVFVPSPAHSPLVIRNGPHSTSNGFVVPQWGGIVIQNVNEGATKKLTNTQASSESNAATGKKKDVKASSDPQAFTFDKTNFKTVAATFASQIRQLLALPSFSRSLAVTPQKKSDAPLIITEIEVLPAIGKGASAFEIDAMKRRIFWTMFSETQHTLTQFYRMVDQMTNIPIHDDIRVKLERALRKREESINLLASDSFSHDDAYLAISDALSLAEEVFFDKDMVGMLYFPSGHELAIYLPLFLPLCFPLISGFKAEISRRKARKAQVAAQ